jgi:hypothetical protein
MKSQCDGMPATLSFTAERSIFSRSVSGSECSASRASVRERVGTRTHAFNDSVRPDE